MRRAVQIARAVIGSPWTRVSGTVVGLAILAHSINLPQAVASLAHADPLWMAAALGLTVLAVAASVVEWGVLLRTANAPAGAGAGSLLSWRRLSSTYLQGVFFTQMLPAGVGGDAMRTVEMGRQIGHGRVLASLAGSRLAGMLGMTCWGIAAAILLRALLGTGVVIVIAGLAAAVVVIWLVALSADRLVPHRLLARLSGAMSRGVRSFSDAFAGYRKHPHAVAQSLLVGAAGWGFNLLALSVAARAIGVDLSWTVLAVCIPITLLVALAPFSINGLGLREGVLVALLSHTGVSVAHAGAISVLIDLQMIPFAVLGAVLWSRRRRSNRTPAQIAIEAARIEDVALAELTSGAPRLQRRDPAVQRLPGGPRGADRRFVGEADITG
ncbi:MAG: lysylphosphatidylglycerol synthase transmembrane domain-containing protein [Candidatus Dormibacteria bacterium]